MISYKRTGWRTDVIVGLSTETKPTDVENGYRFCEIDTGYMFAFDAEHSQWHKLPGSSVDEDEVRAIIDDATAELQAELDEAISGVTVDSEVINARVDADGTTYGTLKQRLDTEHTDLKNKINVINPVELLTGWVDGKYIATNNTTSNPLSPTNDNSYRYLYAAANEGDVYTLNVTGGGAPRAWAFLDASYNVLEPKAIANLTCNNLLVYAPANAAYIIINDKKTNKDCYKGKGIRRDITESNVTNVNCKSIASAVKGIDIANITWEQGVISNLNGKKNPSTSRICTPDYIDVAGYTAIRYSVNSASYGVVFAYYSDQTEDSWVESDPTWLMGNNETAIKGRYVRITLSTGNVANASNLTAIAYNPIVEALTPRNTARENPLHGIAHMGNAGNAYNDPPANTGINYINAANKGYKYVEGDILFTSDGIAVLNHDNDVSLTYTWYYAGSDTRVSTAGEVLISDNSYQVLHDNYDVRRSAGNYITKVLTFEDWIIICRNLNLYPYIELKTDITDMQARYLVGITKAYGMQDNCAWFATAAAILNRILAVYPCARVGYAPTNDSDTTKIATAKSLKTASNEVWVQYRYTNVTPQIIAEAKQADIPMVVCTVDTNTDMLALNEYIMGVLSNTLNYAVVRKNALLERLN